MSEAEATEMLADLESKEEADLFVSALGKSVLINKNMVKISYETITQHSRRFTPSVIEPSFGIGRIVHCLLEHSHYVRPTKDQKENLRILRFSPLVAPFKCSVFALIQKESFEVVAKQIRKSLTKARIRHESEFVGSSGSIGKKYVRADELGVPFVITVDSESEVTIRERDSKDQIRVNVEEVTSLIKKLVNGEELWKDVWSTFPHVS